MNRELKKEIANHLLVGIAIFVFVEILWLLSGSFSLIKLILLLAGILAGTFLLDADHLIYWFFLYPDLEESKRARELWRSRQYKGLLSLLAQTHKRHTSLVFHHLYFQLVLVVLTLFVLTSTASPFAQGLVLAANGHLLYDQISDWLRDPAHLKKWLLARTPLADSPIPPVWIKIYLVAQIIILTALILVSFT